MKRTQGKPSVDPSILIKIIRLQTEIAKLGLDLGAVVSLVAERMQELTNAGGTVVELAEGTEMVYRAASGVAQSMLGLRLNRADSLSGLCVDLAQVIICHDSETDARVDRDACRKVGLRSIVAVPLDHNGTTVGVIKIVSADVSVFTEQDIGILELMSELIAASMFHAAKFGTDELFHRATHDTLTGLANRALFFDRLRHHLAFARRRESQIGILNIDMDGLKSINDGHGHRAGDAAIRETGLRISGVSRESDLVARLGGDEFAVVLSDVRGRESATKAADRIAAQIRLPFRFEEHDLLLDASVGVAIFPDDAGEIEGLIEAADRSMYTMKRTRNPR